MGEQKEEIPVYDQRSRWEREEEKEEAILVYITC
jgi:hypothetical protein